MASIGEPSQLTRTPAGPYIGNDVNIITVDTINCNVINIAVALNVANIVATLIQADTVQAGVVDLGPGGLTFAATTGGAVEMVFVRVDPTNLILTTPLSGPVNLTVDQVVVNSVSTAGTTTKTGSLQSVSSICSNNSTFQNVRESAILGSTSSTVSGIDLPFFNIGSSVISSNNGQILQPIAGVINRYNSLVGCSNSSFNGGYLNAVMLGSSSNTVANNTVSACTNVGLIGTTLNTVTGRLDCTVFAGARNMNVSMGGGSTLSSAILFGDNSQVSSTSGAISDISVFGTGSTITTTGGILGNIYVFGSGNSVVSTGAGGAGTIVFAGSNNVVNSTGAGTPANCAILGQSNTYNSTALGISNTNVVGSNCTITDGVSLTNMIGDSLTTSSNITRSVAIGAFIDLGHTGVVGVGDNSSGGVPLTSVISNQYFARFANGYDLYTDPGATVGAQLLPGATAWSVLSDVRYKENMLDINTKELLDVVEQLPVFTYNYKENNILRIGTSANLVHQLCANKYFAPSISKGRDGVEKFMITSSDLTYLILGATKELNKKINQLERKLDSLNLI